MAVVSWQEAVVTLGVRLQPPELVRIDRAEDLPDERRFKSPLSPGLLDDGVSNRTSVSVVARLECTSFQPGPRLDERSAGTGSLIVAVVNVRLRPPMSTTQRASVQRRRRLDSYMNPQNTGGGTPPGRWCSG